MLRNYTSYRVDGIKPFESGDHDHDEAFTATVQCDDAHATMWTVSGLWSWTEQDAAPNAQPQMEIDALCDCSSREVAEKIAAALTAADALVRKELVF